VWLATKERGNWRRAARNRLTTVSAFAREAVRDLVSRRYPAVGLAQLTPLSRRLGRPRRKERRPTCDRLVAFGVSVDEHAAWSQFAKSEGTTLSALVRGAVEAAIARKQVVATRPIPMPTADKSAGARLLPDRPGVPRPSPAVENEFLAAVAASKIAEARKKADYQARGLSWPPRRPKGYVSRLATVIVKERLEHQLNSERLTVIATPSGQTLREWHQFGRRATAAKSYYEAAGRAAEDRRLLPDARDRQIARAIEQGTTVRDIKQHLRCGQDRIGRVRRTIVASVETEAAD
jgi:hypothetical protein